MGFPSPDDIGGLRAGRLLPGLLIFSALLQPSSPPGSAQPVLEQMAEAYRSFKSLEAKLHQVKSYPQLGITDPPEEGVLYVERTKEDKRIRLEIVKPEKRIVTVKEGKYVLYQPKINQAIEGKVNPKAGSSGGTSFLSYFMGDLSRAQDDYEIVSLGEEQVGGHRTAHLRMNARPNGKGFYRQIDLWVDQELWIPVQQNLVEPNRSETRIELGEIRLNVGLKDSLFKIDLPPGVERVRG